jgi:glycosyltransferase involved in cell wall biosynthesis
MKPREAAFLIPGDLHTRTGGTVYDRRLLETLNQIGQTTRHVPVMTSWPRPTQAAQQELAAILASLPPEMPLIVDGLILGAMETNLLAAQTRRIVAMLHHPLGLEAGLAPDVAAYLLTREEANLRHVAHVVVPSEHTRDILMSDFGVSGTRISVALPGFDRPAPPIAPSATIRPPLILSVGIICARKGHDVLLDALAQVADLDWQTVIVGRVIDDDVQTALLAQRTRLGLDRHVTFAGTITPHALDTLYRQASLFALATRYEGYGMVLSEAQLYGLPILSCAVGAVPQTVARGGAVLVPPDDPGAFAGQMRALLADTRHRDQLARDSLQAGATLPHWQDAARIMQAALQG